MSHPFVHVVASESHADEAAALLLGAGARGTETRDASTMVAVREGVAEVIGWFDEVETAEGAARLVSGALASAGVDVIVGTVEDPGWREAWREFFRPMRFGERLWVTPPDEDPRPELLEHEAGAPAIVRLVPSGAFGTGTHESTALVLELVDAFATPGVSVLDVGCGSGILALAAARLGARPVRGIDIDPEAVEQARRNAAQNDLLRECRFDGTPLRDIEGAFDLVLANLSAPVLRSERERLAGLVDIGGRLLWSGLLETDIDEVGAPPGFALVEDRRRNGWVAQAWQRRDRGAP